MSMYTYFQREAKDLHLPPGFCLKEREIQYLASGTATAK